MGGLDIIIGKASKKLAADDGDGADEEDGGSAEEAAQDLIDAIKSEDAEAVAMAFKAMTKAC